MVPEKSCVGSQSEDSISHMIADPPTICYANNNLFESMHINNQDGLEFVNWSSADDNHFETELEKIDSALLAAGLLIQLNMIGFHNIMTNWCQDTSL